MGYEMWDVKVGVLALKSHISPLASNQIVDSWVESDIRLTLVHDLEAA